VSTLLLDGNSKLRVTKMLSVETENLLRVTAKKIVRVAELNVHDTNPPNP